VKCLDRIEMHAWRTYSFVANCNNRVFVSVNVSERVNFHFLPEIIIRK